MPFRTLEQMVSCGLDWVVLSVGLGGLGLTRPSKAAKKTVLKVHLHEISDFRFISKKRMLLVP